MSNELIKLEIVEKKDFNRAGILLTRYYVYFGTTLVEISDTLEEAEVVYNNILNRKDNPSFTQIKQAYVAI